MTPDRRTPIDSLTLQLPLAVTTLLVAFVALGWTSTAFAFPFEGGLLSVAILMGGLLMLSGCTFRVGLLWSAGAFGWVAASCAAYGALSWAALFAVLAVVLGCLNGAGWRSDAAKRAAR